MSKSIPVSEAATLTLLLEQPDMSETGYQQLVDALKSGHAKEIASKIRQEAPGRAKKTVAATAGAQKTSAKSTKTGAVAKKAPAAAKTAAAKTAGKTGRAAKKSTAGSSLTSARRRYLAK
jgi:hypothetical protein